MFSKEVYLKRRERLCEELGQGLILLVGNSENPRNYTDNAYPFRQDSTFLYYTGINRPNLALIIDIDRNKTILFGNDDSEDLLIWAGKQTSINELAVKSGIEICRKKLLICDYIKGAKVRGRDIMYIPSVQSSTKVQLSHIIQRPIDKLNEKASIKLIQAIVKQREIKSEEELIEIRKAVNVSIKMHKTAIAYAHAGMLEADIVALLHQIAISNECEMSFTPIVTKNGQILHNHYYGNRLEKGDLLLIDAGAETSLGYAGDISSTFPIDAPFSQKQKDIYDISLNAHEAAKDMCLPGISFKDVHKTACLKIAEGLTDLGIMKGDPKEAVALGAHALFFPCGTGHFMGLDVHDMENFGEKWVGYNGQEKSSQFGLKSLRLGKTLLPGHVVTVEPGIYFIPELIKQWKLNNMHSAFINWDKVDTYLDFGGIRNEEDLLITSISNEVLGDSFYRNEENIDVIKSAYKEDNVKHTLV